MKNLFVFLLLITSAWTTLGQAPAYDSSRPAQKIGADGYLYKVIGAWNGGIVKLGSNPPAALANKDSGAMVYKNGNAWLWNGLAYVQVGSGSSSSDSTNVIIPDSNYFDLTVYNGDSLFLAPTADLKDSFAKWEAKDKYTFVTNDTLWRRLNTGDSIFITVISRISTLQDLFDLSLEPQINAHGSNFGMDSLDQVYFTHHSTGKYGQWGMQNGGFFFTQSLDSADNIFYNLFNGVESMADSFQRITAKTLTPYYIELNSKSSLNGFNGGILFHIDSNIVAFSQNETGKPISIGIGLITPDASAILDVDAPTHNKGLLIPRLTTTERDAIISPATGLLIYNTTTNAFNYYNAGWSEIGSGGNTVYTGDGILPSDRNINIVDHSLILSGNSSQFPLLIKDTSGSYENTLFQVGGTINSPSIFLKGTFTDDVDTLSNGDIFTAYNGGMRGFYINPSAPLVTMLSYFEEDKDGLTLRCYTDAFHGMQQCFTSQKNNFGVSFFDDSVNTYAVNITPGAINFSTNNMGDHVQHTAFEYQPTYNFNVQFPLLQADATYQNNTLLSLSKDGDFQINGTHIDGSGNGAINPNLIVDALGSTTFSSLNSDGITSSERVKINSHNDIVDIVFSNSNVGIGTHPVVTVDILGETQIVGQSTTTNTLNVQNANSGTGYTQVWGRSGFGNFAWLDANGNFEANSLKQDVFNSSMITTDGSGKLIAATAGTDYSLPGVLTYNHTIFTPATGNTITIVNKQYNIVNPAGALLALTVNLPASPNDKDVVIIKFTKAVTTVTYSGGTISDSLISPVAGGVSILTYDSGTSTWY